MYANAAADTPAPGATKPKYGPAAKPIAIPLSQDSAYFRSSAHAAADFWALIPYYVGQQHAAGCSTASLAMVMNAARAGQKQGSEDKLVSEDALLDQVKVENYPARIRGDGALHPPTGVELDPYAHVVEAALQAHGFTESKVEAFHVADTGPKSLNLLRTALTQNEKSTDDFIVINFVQSKLTDDADAGHLAPIGAYDAKNHRVLVLDPDREYYEPYWVSDEALLAAMATLDKSATKNRGYVWIHVGKRKSS